MLPESIKGDWTLHSTDESSRSPAKLSAETDNPSSCAGHPDGGVCSQEADCQNDNCGATTGSASPELDAALPRQTRVRMWESALDLTARPKREDLPPVPERIHRRWDRFVRLVGNDGIRRLLGSHVTIFGLGGVGSYVAEALARSAVGRMTLVDFDDVCLTNVNRQLQAFPGTVGQSKAALLAERVRAIHPEAWVDPVQAFYDASTSAALLTPRPDFVVDAIDNVTSKVLLLETCLTQGIPVISITGAGARFDPTQVRVADLSRTKVDPLARILRKELAKRGFGVEGDTGLPVVYSEEEVCAPEVPEWDLEQGFQCICPHREDSPHACEKRRVIYGTATFMTAAFAMAAAAVVVKNLSKDRTDQGGSQ
ncbi:MAG TPA: tRNA threonylcarbamoyladenosine dehydratase [Planctomycetaceae bacterium]|nr:tRNA threonylcarbamoyladenosine dehydratase [Planctomycetaceae bacterium]HQZ65278.1 tRNA threonylcarbamoyladenosine dehydratase [Planctomycetaceae bacterium]